MRCVQSWTTCESSSTSPDSENHNHPASGIQKWWLTDLGRTSGIAGSGSRRKEERVGVGWRSRRQEGIWRHQERKLRWKVRSDHLPRLFNIERNFWWGQSSELRWTNAEEKRHVVHLCDVTGLGWWLLTFASNTGELQYTDTILCILTHKNLEGLTTIIHPSHTLWYSSRSGLENAFFFPSTLQILSGKNYFLININRCRLSLQSNMYSAHPIPWIRMSGTIPEFQHTTSWQARRRTYLQL